MKKLIAILAAVVLLSRAAPDTDEGYPDSDSVAWVEGEGQHYLPDR